MTSIMRCAQGAVLLLAAAATAAAGPIHPETGAGRLPITAETVVVPGSVTHIVGELTGGTLARGVDALDYEDMYLISIPAGCGDFSANTLTVTPGSFNDFDTQLWLFDLSGRGLLGNNDASPVVLQSLIQFPANDGPPAPTPFPGGGLYYLAISGAPDVPLSAGGPIFDLNDPPGPTQISSPDGPGGAQPIIDWSHTGLSAIGRYDIELHCVEGVPEPATALLWLVGAAAGLRRRGKALGE